MSEHRLVDVPSKPFSDRNYGRMIIFTPTGEFPAELRANTMDGIESDPVSLLPLNAIPLVTPPVRSPINSRQSTSTYRHPSTDAYFSFRHYNSRGEVGFSASPCISNSDDHVVTIVGEKRQQHSSSKCERCRVFIPGDGKDCRTDLAAGFDQVTSMKCLSKSLKVKPSSDIGPRPKEGIETTRIDDYPLSVMTDMLKTEKVHPSQEKVKSKQRPPQSPYQVQPAKRDEIDRNYQNILLPERSAQKASTMCKPRFFKAKNIGCNKLKLCSVHNCTGIIASESSARRCLSCVKLAWKSRKSKWSEIPVSVSSRASEDVEAPTDVVPLNFTKQTPRKSVTWADLVADSPKDALFNRIPAENVDREPPPAKKDIASSKSRPNSINQAPESRMTVPTDHFSGWDSELSDLSEIDENDSPTEVKQSAPCLTTTGLKIRIPPRPAGIYSRKCATPTCIQFIADDFSRINCVVCRARNRHFQQKRKVGNDDIDGELLEGHGTGTPLPLEFLQDIDPTEAKQDSIMPVPNARLCSNYVCTFIIPPFEEYGWGRCSLCRLRDHESRSSQRKSGFPCDQSHSDTIKRHSGAKLFYLFSFLPIRPPTPGRCHSTDCGVLIDGTSTLCKQCVARRSWLKQKAGILEGQFIENVHKPSLELRSYPQYRCSNTLVRDLGNRLFDFLKAQSAFCLFKADCSIALFTFDGEFSVVALDFDVVSRKSEIDVSAVKLKKELERVGRLKFAPNRLISVLEGGGVAIRFTCTHQALIPQPVEDKDVVSVTESTKVMHGELEIAVLPEYSHPFLPGQKTIVRCRLLG